MKKVIIKTGTEADFFKRGRKISKALDACKPLSSKLILSFEDPSELISLISGRRLSLFRAIKKDPGSITDIAKRLNRTRRCIQRDIDAMQSAGLIIVTEKTSCGRGRVKEVSAIAERISINVDIY